MNDSNAEPQDYQRIKVSQLDSDRKYAKEKATLMSSPLIGGSVLFPVLIPIAAAWWWMIYQDELERLGIPKEDMLKSIGVKGFWKGIREEVRLRNEAEDLRLLLTCARQGLPMEARMDARRKLREMGIDYDLPEAQHVRDTD